MTEDFGTFVGVFFLIIGVLMAIWSYLSLRTTPKLSPDRYVLFQVPVYAGAMVVSGTGRLLAETTQTASLIFAIAWGIAAPVGIALLIAFWRAKQQISDSMAEN